MRKYEPVQSTIKGINLYKKLYLDIKIKSLETNNGCGAYSIPYLIHSGDDSQRVLKSIYYSENANQLRSLFREYLCYLIELNITFPKTDMNKDDKLFFTIQDFQKGESFLEKISQSENDNNSKLKLFEKLISKTSDIFDKIKFIEKKNDKLGFDSRLENWIYHNDDLIFVDLFPPLLINSSNILKQEFYSTDFEKKFSDNPDKTFLRNKNKALARLTIEASIIAPYQKSQFIEISSNYIDDRKKFREIISRINLKNNN